MVPAYTQRSKGASLPSDPGLLARVSGADGEKANLGAGVFLKPGEASSQSCHTKTGALDGQKNHESEMAGRSDGFALPMLGCKFRVVTE
ncbi:hypothetical protein [Brytella acorum]|uniref:Uncharacterized protein n=1 Tax=Brytella acorum TaxID=2959299 RepID=A0AA35UXI1_9PROT|nr:hypothetical protein [Brytella acorum]MDF3625665.1 hypothetical protein [Brytella acorum]CAI9121294.1 hypothetical protein LMG32879_002141 [Brytella acorum]